MRIETTILGSGTLVPDDRYRSACHLIEGCREGEAAEPPVWRLLFDIGFGALHGMTRFGLAPWSLDTVVLSHWHTDHIGDLAPLLFALTWAAPEPRVRPLRLVGPVGLGDRLEGLARAHGSFILEPPFPLEVVEVPEGGSWHHPEGWYRLACAPTGHTPEALAWRLDVAGEEGAPTRSVGYTGDAGASAPIAPLLSGVDLLIAECAYADPPPWEGHLAPSGVAALCTQVRPRQVLLTHLYTDDLRRTAADRVREHGWSGAVQVAEDGTRFVLD